MEEVATWLAHSTGYRTTERYQKIGPDHLSKAVEAMEAYFADLEPGLPTRTLDHSTNLRAYKPHVTRLQNLVPQKGLEPPTHALRMRCSTN